MKTCSVIVIAFFVLLENSFAQNMNNPYSVYGIGDVELRAFNRSSGIGNTGLAIRSSAYIIVNNPASLTGMDKSILVLEAATNGKSLKYAGTPVNTNNNDNRDFTIERISLAIKLNKFWGSNIGFKKFSTVSYQFKAEKQLEGSTKTYMGTYSGDGGLNDFYWNNSFAIGKHLSLGIRSSILNGSINQNEKISDEASAYSIESKIRNNYNRLWLQYGFIYSTPLSKKTDLSVGGNFSAKTKLISARSLTVIDNSTTIIQDKYMQPGSFMLPHMYALGFALKNKKGTTVAADYHYENWSASAVKENGWSLRNSDRLSAGIEFSRLGYFRNMVYEKRFFQLGAYVSRSYLSVRNNHVKSFGITAGLGGAIQNNLLYSIAAEAGTRGTINNGLIKENYLGLTITLSYRELMRNSKAKYD